jgi:broad specificity phosphatase PhoE
MKKIVLVRHGRSAHVQTGWIDSDGLQRWRLAYDEAGITDREPPPAALRAMAEGAGVLAASDLPRALASAAMLAPGRDVVVSPLLRESVPALPTVARLRLPLMGWALVMGLQGLRRKLRSESATPADVLARADEAAEWLAGLAAEHGSVVAVTHAAFRGRVADALHARGWRTERGTRVFHHWSARVLAAPK